MILPQITVEITLADDAVCPSCAGPDLDGTGATDITDANVKKASYELTNISMQVEVLGMATSVLDQITEQRIASVGYLSLGFKNIFAYVGTHGGTTRFSVNSASWDRVWVCYRATTYADTAGAHRVPGYKKADGQIVRSTALVDGALTASTALVLDNLVGNAPQVGDIVSALPGINQTVTIAAVISATAYTLSTAVTVADNTVLTFRRDAGAPEYDLGGVLDTNKEKYIPSYFRMQELLSGSAPATYQLQINGATVPAFKVNRNEMYAITRNSVDSYHTEHSMTLDQYTDSYFVQCFRFCLPDSEMSRLASGLDTRSVSAQAALETQGLSSCHVTIFAECSSELRVGKFPCQQLVQVGA